MNPLLEFTAQLTSGRDLARAEIAAAICALLDESLPDQTKADFLTALARKGETAGEIAAFALELRGRAVDPQLDYDRLGNVVFDIVGTGADGAHTFNVSTCVVFIAAAAGIAVAKHGNRAITSKCGSADVLAALGARIELPPAAARRCLEETGLAFFFAPLYHPCFKKIAPVRRQLAERKQRTVFNILGPLVNPARPTHQVIGVFERSLVAKYAQVLNLLGLKHAMVVHGDGLDEFTTLGPNTVAELWGTRIEESEKTFSYTPSDIQISAPTLQHLAGADPLTNAQIVRNILDNQDRGPKRDIVLLNAAAALVVAGKAADFPTGWTMAGQLIDTGAARAKLDVFVAASNVVS
jgi:anthranilate phosphoribosyltransferase